MHVNYIEWHTHPLRSQAWFDSWGPAIDRALAAGAEVSYLTRNTDDPLHFRQVSIWRNREDFETYWYSDEVSKMRAEAVDLYNKPVLPVWHSLVGE